MSLKLQIFAEHCSYEANLLYILIKLTRLQSSKMILDFEGNAMLISGAIYCMFIQQPETQTFICFSLHHVCFSPLF